MTFPINPTTVAAAARLATDVAGRIGEAVSFDQILNSPDPASEPDQLAATEGSTPADRSKAGGGWLEQTIARIRDLFSGAGVEPDRPVTLAADPEGQLQFRDDHPRAAELESLLASDRELRQLVGGLVRQTGQTTVTVPPTGGRDLTRADLRANMN